ncbi:MAG TPA: acyltransferase [Saprospiraceae bacterium]|nr:acyltransferase [Saprospiraceae bacterium]HMQ82182.1 acyltransferase [Saprospiraceae bacterium]
MTNSATRPFIFADTKKHYEILDGLRGVASIVVVFFHIFEIYSGGDHTKQILNHGYLAVDFFFLLSGFVIAHAYDNRWNKMSLKHFFTRRLIRLHPMIIAGITLGAVCFYFSASPILFPNISSTPLWQVLLTMLLGYFLIPIPVSMEIRGWTEMYPLNGPVWTLFFEYIANILYALFLRKTSNTVLSILVVIAGIALAHYAITGPTGDLIGGWAITPEQLRVGFTRLLYPFLAGLLLHRFFKPISVKNAFFWCSALLVVLLCIPRVGGSEHLWMNGIYDAFVVICCFPLIVFLGASGEVKGRFATKLCRFLGDISYPIYLLHFPLTYIFYAWVVNNQIPMSEALPAGVLVLLVSIGLSYACLKVYDIPVRRWLAKKWLEKG